MIPRECKRLAEVDFPIARVSRSATEGGGRSATPSALHLWWSRKPLAACRAIALALLLPDPCDPSCPPDFKHQARSLLHGVVGRVGESDLELRAALLVFIASFASPNSASRERYVETSRALVGAAYDSPPLVVDSFAGGGSIPLEAMRIGCDVFASDSNPISSLMLKVLLADAPRQGTAIAEQMRIETQRIQQDIDGQLSEYYWRDNSGGEPIAYLWARTVQCETPNCGAEVPIYGTPWLAKRGASKARYFKETSAGRCVALIVDSAPRGGPINLRIARGVGSEIEMPGYVPLAGTKVKGNSGGVICPCCKTTLPGTRTQPRVQTQLNGSARWRRCPV